MNSNDIRPGHTIQGPKWAESVRVYGVERIGRYIHLIGGASKTRTVVDCILTQSDIQRLEIVGAPASIRADPQRALLSIEAMRYKYASDNDALSMLHSSAVDILPHQVEAVYNYALRWPHVRFILAHEAGSGKTIMAGLIVKELKARKAIRGALVVASRRLHSHWQHTMQQLGEHTIIADYEHPKRIWNDTHITISSPDYLEREDVMPYLEPSPPDLIIVDEAHILPLRPEPRADAGSLVALFGSISDHLLLLTATPPPEGSANLRALLDMLEPGFLSDTKMTKTSIGEADNPLFLRRTAETLTDMDGNPLYGDRTIQTILVTPSEIEAILYGAIHDYAKKQYQTDPDHTTEILRAASSSVYATLQTLERRVRYIKDNMHNYTNRTAPPIHTDQAEADVKSLDRLITMARRVLDSDLEQKIIALRHALMQTDGTKTLVLTESADTLHYLVGCMKSWGYATCAIHGNMEHETRKQIEDTFRAGADIMVATDIISTGSNLHYCNNMINFDTPWESDVMARRFGCLHKYGNTADIAIHSMLVADIPGSVVMSGLLDHISGVMSQMKNDRMLDWIQEALPVNTLHTMMTYAAAGVRDPKSILDDMKARLDEWYYNEGQRILSDASSRPMDHVALSMMVDDSRVHMISPEYVQDTVSRILDVLGGRVRRRPDGLYAIDYIPPALNPPADIPDRYPKIVFDASQKTDAELVTLGHPLFGTMMRWIADNCSDDIKGGAVFTDPDGIMDGHILFHEVVVTDGTGAAAGKRLVSHFVDRSTGKTTNHHPSVLWDLQPGGEHNENLGPRAAEVRAAEAILDSAERYRDEMLMERSRQAEVRKRYGLASIDYVIQNMINEIEESQDPDRVREAVQKKIAYEEYRRSLSHRTSQEQELIISAPNLVGWVRVVPGATGLPRARMHVLGIKTAMTYEREAGRLPVDVSGRSMGYDIESRDAKGRARYIAIRARESTGGVSMTPNEMRVARNTGSDYYLYVIYDDQMIRVQDPGHVLATRRGDIRHAISTDDIHAHAEP